MDSLWSRFQKFFLRYEEIGFGIDISRMRFADDFFASMEEKAPRAFAEMHELEAGGSRTQPRNAWSAITGCGTRDWRRRRNCDATLRRQMDVSNNL